MSNLVFTCSNDLKIHKFLQILKKNWLMTNMFKDIINEESSPPEPFSEKLFMVH